jgi:uncharacterized protein (TIGR02118 family)
MRKFVVVYYRVDDEAALEQFYNATHLPLVEQLPGLLKLEVSRVTGQPTGLSRFHLMVEAYFATEDSLRRALISPQGLQMMDALRVWADAKLLIWFYADAFEEEKAVGGEGG